MTAKISVNNRIKIGFAFAIVFLLVLATNRLDKRRFDTLSQTLTSVYEDRLVAKGYLYELNNIFHDQEKILNDKEEYLIQKSYHSEVDELINKFQSTKLTRNEKSSFNNFQTHFIELKGYEKSLSTLDSEDTAVKLKMQLNRIQNDLDDLALIQLSEGESLTKFAKNSLDTSSFMSKIEIAVMIFIGILVQFIIFYK